MNIALYFGSFNPVHLGHVKLAEYLIENSAVDEVWFIVSPCNPLKDQKELIDEYLRLDMLMLAIKEQPKFKASDVEFTMPIPSYTIDTLYKLKTNFPQHHFSLMIGSDNALVFHKWKKYKQLLKHFEVFVYPRTGYYFSEVAAKYPQMKLTDTPLYDISSTQIRADLAQKKDVNHWLHPDVFQFIIENNLYQNQQ
ncbi:MAG: nicotinate (nicotinamide) nucleotide adenylyltransferase [Paludibacter sp.]|nr:nicotinate (nicotinamide) nucleotide adenylyltransferase [Paludibacter sp.]